MPRLPNPLVYDLIETAAGLAALEPCPLALQPGTVLTLCFDALSFTEPAATSAASALGGLPNLRKAALRRAISTAYYATFHALCSVCAMELVGWGRSDIHEPVYRMLDHGAAKRRLNGREATAIAQEIAEIASLFADLQDVRYAADYGPPTLPVHPDETLGHIAAARRVVALIESLKPEDRKKLAILLITKARQG